MTMDIMTNLMDRFFGKAVSVGARLASGRDVKQMVGIVECAGRFLHLGEVRQTWPMFHAIAGLRSAKLGLAETLSVLVQAPPGTGKTSRIVVPSIVGTEGCSFVVHDPKGELWDICSGWSASQGAAYRLDWSKTDDPDTGTFHPKFNFIGRSITPPAGPKRDVFIDWIAKILIEGNARTASQRDKENFFVDKPRSALVGFAQYLIAKVNDDVENGSRYDGLPRAWHGREASLPMLAAWIVHAEQQAYAKARERRDPGIDPLGEYLSSLVADAVQRKYPKRCIRELSPLVYMTPKERSGVLGIMNAALLSFRHPAVSERTSASNVVVADLAGRLKAQTVDVPGLPTPPTSGTQCKDNTWEPVAVYLSTNPNDLPASRMLNALFVELCSKELFAAGPGEQATSGAVVGPVPTCFMLDNLHDMDACDAVLDGPDLGPSKGRFYVLVSQFAAHIERSYGVDGRRTLECTCAARVVLAQNDQETIDELGAMVGDAQPTLMQRLVGKAETFPRRLLNTAYLAGAMGREAHLLIVRGFHHRPILCKSPGYYTDAKMLERTWDPAGRRRGRVQGLRPPQPMLERAARPYVQ